MPGSSTYAEELTRRARQTERRLRKLEAADRPGAGGTGKDLGWFNVLDYGADKTGSTECRSAFADACTAIRAAGAGVLYVPEGTYLVDTDSYANAINLPSNCWMLMAPGAVLQLAALDAGDNSHAVVRISLGKTNVRVTGGTIIGQRTGPSDGEAGFGVMIEKSCSNVLVEGVTIRDMWGDGVYIGGSSETYPDPCTHIKILRCDISNCRRQGITLTYAEDVTLEDNTIYDINGTNPQSGIDIEPNAGQHVQDVRVTKNEITDCVGGGVKIQCLAAAEDRWTRGVICEENHITCPGTTGISFWGPGLTDCVAEGNYIYATTYGIYVDNYPVGLTVVGNHIYEPGTGIWLSGAQRSVFSHNNVFSPSSNGVRATAEGDQYFAYNDVSHNHVFTPGANGLSIAARYCNISHNTVYSAVGHGLYLNSCLGCNVVGNTLIGCGTDGSSAALNIFSCVGCQVTDNLIRALGVTDRGIVLNAPSVDNIVRNNDIYDLPVEDALVDAATGTITVSGNRTEDALEPPDPPPPPPSGLVPGHYWMLDAGAVDRELATALFYWDELEPTAGNYNWSIVDNWLADHPDGIIQVFFHTSGMDGAVNFPLHLPPGVPYYTITNSGKQANIPAYDSSTFRSRYIAFIQAFGARYNGQPVIAGLGLDGETQCAKTQDGVDWVTACYGTVANAVPYRFRTTYLTEILTAYAQAFPDSVVLVNCAPGGTDTRKAVLPLAIDLGLGLKHSGLIEDTDSWLGYDTDQNPPTLEGVLAGTYTGLLGLWDIIRMGKEAGLTIVTESAYGYSADPLKALRSGLMYHPQAMCWHPEWFTSLLTQDEFDWAEKYLGVTTANTPGVWWAEHTTAYPITAVGSSGYYSGHGHCEFWLVKTNATTWVVDEDVTITDPTILIQYTGTGTMTVNGTSYPLDASGQLVQAVSGSVTTVTVTGAEVTFLELMK